MDKIEVSQNNICNQIEKIFVNFKKAGKDRLTRGFIETRMQMADNYWNTFEQQNDNLLSAGSKYRETSEYFKSDAFDKCFDKYLELKTLLSDKLNEINVSCPVETEKIIQQNTSVAKLPSIHLPKFSGDYKEWLSFRDLFQSLVHTNTTINKVNKCQYLKSSLCGEAEIFCKQIQVSEINYDILWAMLNKRYNNKRSMVNTFIAKLLNHKRITTESAKNIRELLDCTTECLATLKSLDLPTEKWDDLVVYIVIQKLDPESHKLFEQRIESTDNLPTWKDLSDFLEFRFRTLEAMKPKEYAPRIMNTQRSFTTQIRSRPVTCNYCKEDHLIYHCKEFCKLELQKRKEFVQNNQLCFNCLKKGHDVKTCIQSTSCRKCGRRHHSLIHGYVSTDTNKEQSETVTTLTTTTKTFSQPHQVILATALIKVQSQKDPNQKHTLRALIDQGSQASLITEEACQSLGLKRSSIRGTVTGVGSSASTIKASVKLRINSSYNPNIEISINAFVLKTLTGHTPQQSHSIDWPQLKELQLADPTFQRPGKIDILLGADVFAHIIQDGIIRLKDDNNTLIAQQTTLGWLISGNHNRTDSLSIKVNVHHVNIELDTLLRQFWEIEENIDKRIMTKEELQCEKHYEKTHERSEEGRYSVRLPFKCNPPDIGESLSLAKKRFDFLENKFKRNPNLHKRYNDFMTDYLNQGHMEPCTDDNTNHKICYIPHHAVINEDHLTTKLRVVFDSSAKTSNGKSLNDNLLVGPALQNDLRNVTLRWRRHKFALIGDIRQMYRQIDLHEKDRDYLRILWRLDTGDLQHYRLKTVTYGTSCAPYLAIKTLKQLAEDERGNFDDQIVDTVLFDFYIDDLLTGHNCIQNVLVLKNKLTKMLHKGGFTLHKWASNSSKIKDVDQSIRKILGIVWNGITDEFELQITLPPPSKSITKRTVLRDIASIYDPIGWLAPIVVVAKHMLQQLWTEKVDWDDPLPDSLLHNWLTYKQELLEMPIIKVPRWLGITDKTLTIELHGFSDASNIAYSAVVYCRVITATEIIVTIIEAKTRIAPVKQISLPRLELCGAVLLAKLLHRSQNALKVPLHNIYAWTDATIVLAWLQKSPCHWCTFVANRVTEITNLISKDRWHHVTSENNPADVASRGTSPSYLSQHPLWWGGPAWLSEAEALPLNQTLVEPTDLESKSSLSVNSVLVGVVNQKPKSESEKCQSLTMCLEFNIMDKYSTLTKLIRVMCRVLRFIKSLKHKLVNKSNLPFSAWLTTDELKMSMKILIKLSQCRNFAKEIEIIKNNNVDKFKQLNKLENGRKIYKLNPYLDNENLLRVGGRLYYSSLSNEMKHPYILSKDCKLSYLLIQDAHLKTLHGGVQLTLFFLRTKYHIIKCRSFVKHVIHKCIICVKNAANLSSQQMGNLPKERVNPQRPFSVSGVDFAGPVTLKLFNGRGSNRTQKAYIAVFICLSVKAVHLELVTSLSSESFIAAFRRFTARRGHCHQLVSDCGTNFVGANKDLKQMLKESKINLPSEICDLLAQDGTEWKFNPAGAPHMGGLWEAAVKSVKFHLNRVLSDTKLIYEEYSTLLCQIECCLNSRPLVPINDDSLEILTPGHFLIGETMITVPERDIQNVKISYLQRWTYLQQKIQSFWHKWSHDYLVTLQNRNKWVDNKPNLVVGNIVLVKDNRLPVSKWLIARVVETHPGSDGLVRVVSLKCKNHIIKRPIHKLCLLPTESD